MSLTRVAKKLSSPRAPRAPRPPSPAVSPSPGGSLRTQATSYHTTRARQAARLGVAKRRVCVVPPHREHILCTDAPRSGVFHGRSREIRPRERKGVLCVLFGVCGWCVCKDGMGWRGGGRRLSLNRRAELGVWLPTQRGLATLGWPGSLRWEPTAGETHHCRQAPICNRDGSM